MKSQVSEKKPKTSDTESSVAEYLSAHPEFFERHPNLLRDLRIPHQSGNAVSLVERQIETLRQQLDEQRTQLQDLIEVARENDVLADRLHRLTLALIDAVNFDELVNALQDELHDDFKADAVELRLFSATDLGDHGPTENTGSEQEAEITLFQEFIAAGLPLCGPLTQSQLDYLFGPEADDTKSAALIPLNAEGVLGILAIGSQDAERFNADKSTDFLVRLGEIVSRTLQTVTVPGI